MSEQFRDQYAKVVIDLRNANLAVDTCRAHLLEWQARGSSKTSIVATSAHAGLNDPTAQARVVQGAVHTARRCAAMLLEASQLEITQDASPAGADDEVGYRPHPTLLTLPNTLDVFQVRAFWILHTRCFEESLGL